VELKKIEQQVDEEMGREDMEKPNTIQLEDEKAALEKKLAEEADPMVLSTLMQEMAEVDKNI